MKRKTSTKACASLALLGCVVAGGVAKADMVQPSAGQASVTLNGQPLATAVAPQIRGGITLVPMRDIFQALGATVVWDAASQEIRAQKKETAIWLKIGSQRALVADKEHFLSQPPVLYVGSTLVPLRFVAESLGAQVDWNGATRVVAIQTSDPVTVVALPPVDEENNEPVAAGTEVKGSLTIPSGAVVPVTLDETLSSNESKVGDRFTTTVKSDKPGDSEFPANTKIVGRVTEVQPKTDKGPGVISVEFVSAELPDGTTVDLRGALTSLDDDSVTHANGRILAKKSATKSKDKTKIIGIGAGAGFILGKILGKNSTITAILGAAGGYLYSKKDKNKEQEAVVEKGATLGVRLTESVTYKDLAYYDEREPYLSPA